MPPQEGTQNQADARDVPFSLGHKVVENSPGWAWALDRSSETVEAWPQMLTEEQAGRGLLILHPPENVLEH